MRCQSLNRGFLFMLKRRLLFNISPFNFHNFVNLGVRKFFDLMLAQVYDYFCTPQQVTKMQVDSVLYSVCKIYFKSIAALLYRLSFDVMPFKHVLLK